MQSPPGRLAPCHHQPIAPAGDDNLCNVPHALPGSPAKRSKENRGRRLLFGDPSASPEQPKSPGPSPRNRGPETPRSSGLGGQHSRTRLFRQEGECGQGRVWGYGWDGDRDGGMDRDGDRGRVEGGAKDGDGDEVGDAARDRDGDGDMDEDDDQLGWGPSSATSLSEPSCSPCRYLLPAGQAGAACGRARPAPGQGAGDGDPPAVPAGARPGAPSRQPLRVWSPRDRENSLSEPCSARLQGVCHGHRCGAAVGAWGAAGRV